MPPVAIIPPVFITPPVLDMPPDVDIPPFVITPPVFDTPPVDIIPPVLDFPPTLEAPAMFDMPPVVMAPPVGAPVIPPLVPLSEAPGLLLEQANIDRDPNKPNVLHELNRIISLSIVKYTACHQAARIAQAFNAPMPRIAGATRVCSVAPTKGRDTNGHMAKAMMCYAASEKFFGLFLGRRIRGWRTPRIIN
jgi:hypothetical protein